MRKETNNPPFSHMDSGERAHELQVGEGVQAPADGGVILEGALSRQSPKIPGLGVLDPEMRPGARQTALRNAARG